ncbi:MAG: glycosyltransferase family 39 protein, partial [Gemmatimonadota bacterium]
GREGGVDGAVPSSSAALEWRHGTLVLLALLVALALRVWLALRTQVWLDEANSVLIALGPVSELPATMAQDSSPPLYYLLLKAWAALAGIGPLALRIPSIAFGCAAVPAIWLVGRAMDRARTGVVAAWLIAVSPLHAYYSEEIRMYAMLVLLGLLFYYAVFDVLRRTENVWPAILTGVAVAYTHYYGLIFVGCVLAVAFVAMRERRKRLMLSGAAVAVAFLPWLPVFLAQLENPHHFSWIGEYWEQYPRGMAVVRTIQAFTPGGLKYPLVPLRGIVWQPVVAGLLVLPFGALAVSPRWRRHLRPLVLPTLVTALMLAALAIRSYVGAPIYLAGRSDVVLLPLFLLVLAGALARIGARMQILFVVAWTVLAGFEVAGSADILRKAGNVEMLTALDDAGCETIVATGLSYASLVYYEGVEADGARVVPYPIDVGEHPGNFDLDRYTLDQLNGDARVLAGQFPPTAGTCLVAWAESFPGPLGNAYLSTGARGRSLGNFRASMITTDYVLVRF